MEKDQERDQNMAKIMTQLDIFSKNFMGAGARGVNIVGIGYANPEEAKFDALYNEEVEVWKMLEKLQGGEQQVQLASRRRGRRTRPIPSFDSRHLQIEVCKTR
uniref:Uncharacterized protein n=1 Tax=Solanum tuberosum TaxID=4113 RepID=M1DCE9_SOLTU